MEEGGLCGPCVVKKTVRDVVRICSVKARAAFEGLVQTRVGSCSVRGRRMYLVCEEGSNNQGMGEVVTLGKTWRV